MAISHEVMPYCAPSSSTVAFACTHFLMRPMFVVSVPQLSGRPVSSRNEHDCGSRTSDSNMPTAASMPKVSAGMRTAARAFDTGAIGCAACMGASGRDGRAPKAHGLTKSAMGHAGTTSRRAGAFP